MNCGRKSPVVNDMQRLLHELETIPSKEKQIDAIYI